MKSTNRISRRSFLGTAASAACAVTVLDGRLLGAQAPSNKLHVAIIGAGGRGGANIRGVKDENVVALCDVDTERAAGAVEKYPKAKFFRDFRVLFDEMTDSIEAVVISTPDHTHYTSAMAAIERGKHVYCEKPLAHSVYEVNALTKAARDAGVQTQLGNQGHSSEDIRRVCEWIADGAIGQVRQVHAWSDRPMRGFPFPSSIGRPTATPPVPAGLDWNLWLGPVAHRPYHPLYAPFFWRGWLDFGTGALGDMGCHILDPSFWALRLGSPLSVEANVTYNPGGAAWQEAMEARDDPDPDARRNFREVIREHLAERQSETFPAASKVVYRFPAREGMDPVELTWYDGGMLPRIEGMGKLSGSGAILVGEKGFIKHGSHGAGGAKIFPEGRMQEYMQEPPEPTIERVAGHHADWIQACKGGTPASSNFDYGGPLTEMVLLGVIAMRVPNERLDWDGGKMEFTNRPEATAFVKPVYENGWEL